MGDKATWGASIHSIRSGSKLYIKDMAKFIMSIGNQIELEYYISSLNGRSI